MSPKILLTIFLFQTAQAQSEPSTRELQIIQNAEAFYQQVAKKSGQTFSIQIHPESSIASGEAESDGQSLQVILNGGLFHSPRLTDDALLMLICHEIGHLEGGAPRKDAPYEWEGPTASDGRLFLSSEGQADYYASAVCFRQLVNKADAASSLSEVTPRLQKLCQQSHSKNQNDYELCLRSAVAGKDMLQVSYNWPLSFETPDLSKSPQLIRNAYPSAQCRLDTLTAGALCPSDLPLTLDFNKASKNDCSLDIGRRPPCWFRE